MEKNQSLIQNHTWKNKTALFLASQNISLFGSSVISFAIIWYITLETSSGRWMMFSTICSLLPQVAISLWAGVWADRHDRKKLIILSDGLISFSTLGLAIAFFAGYRRMELLLAVSVIRSLGAGVQMPALNAILPQIVPTGKLTRVNGINQTLNSILFLLSPAVGGLMLTYFDLAWTFMLDVITAAVAIIFLAFLKIPPVQQLLQRRSMFTDLRQGVAYTFNHYLLRRLVIFYAFSYFLITPAAFLTPIMVERSFGSEVWRLTANEMVWSVGSLLGGIYVSLRGNFKNKITTIAVSLVAFGITFASLGLAPRFWLYLGIMGLAGFFMPLIATAETVLIQENVEAMMLGRVFSIIQIISAGAMPVAMLLFGPLADMIQIEQILLITGTILAALGFIFPRHCQLPRLKK